MFKSFVPPPKEPLPVSPEYVAEVKGWLEEKPRVFLPPATDRAVWDALPVDKYAFIRTAEEDLKQSIPKLTDDLYLDFMKSGQREPFTVPYNQWIDRAANLALAESLEFKGRFIPALRETMFEILAEPMWVFPMHDGPIGWEYFKGGHIYTDLGAAMRVGALAAIDGWLGGQLGSDLRAKLRAETKRRIVDPYLGYVYGKDRGTGWWWVVATTNWNSVCHAGVAYATMALIDDIETRAKVAAATARHMSLYFQGFTPDGYISEGMGYWNYGFGHFTVVAETLLRATGGKLNVYKEHAAKVGAVSSYPIRCEIAPHVYPAFSDCGMGAEPSPWVFRTLGRHVALPESAVPEKPDYAMSGAHIYIKDIDLAPAPAKTTPRIPIPDYHPLHGYFEEAGILISRATVPGQGVAMAVKGGHNEEMHNHNDVGAFTVACNGKAVLADLGAEVYHKRSFSDQRYESKMLNSYGHPVPVIDGHLQAVGRKAEAKTLEASFSDAADKFVIDMAPAYPDVKGLEQVKRTFLLERTGATAFTVTDEIVASRPVRIDTALMTGGTCERVGDNRLRFSWNGGVALVDIDTGGEPFSVRDEMINERVLNDVKPRRIGIALEKPVARARISFRITTG